MRYSFQIRQPADPSYVNVNQGNEVSWWCQKLGCSVSQLQAAVGAVGTNAVDVERRVRSERPLPGGTRQSPQGVKARE